MRGASVLSSPPAPLARSVTILLFNSSRRSLVLVKQFRPGEGGPVRQGEGGPVRWGEALGRGVGPLCSEG